MRDGRKNAPQRRGAKAHDAYPLRTVTAMTGLTPDLIRAWEKRYAVVAPVRGARGARLYTTGDIAHLRLLARVVGAGRAIGDVAALRPAESEKLAARCWLWMWGRTSCVWAPIFQRWKSSRRQRGRRPVLLA